MSYLLPHLHTGYAVDRAIMEVRHSLQGVLAVRLPWRDQGTEPNSHASFAV